MAQNNTKSGRGAPVRMLRTIFCMVILFLLSNMLASPQTKGMRILDRHTNKVHTIKGYENSYAVCIGIDEYTHWPTLSYAVPDAVAMKEKLLERGFDEIKLIVNEEATKESILSGIAWLGKVTGEEDRAVIYFSGHGETKEGRGGAALGYVIPVNCPKEDYYVNAISMGKIREATYEIKAKHILYIMDSCYSGTALMATRGDEEFVIEMTRDPCVYMMTAGKAGEQALEVNGHGVFTQYVLRGLDGEADYDKNGVVSGTELGLYSRKWVSHAAKQRNRTQTPQFGRIDGEGEIIFQSPVEPIDVTTGLPGKINSKDGTAMVLIPAGDFQMGGNHGTGDEEPVHTVYLDDFYIDVFEVTNRRYEEFMNATGHEDPVYWRDPKHNSPRQPVVGVSWQDAQSYCQWAGKRLPSEAEWEKAARGNSTGKKYPWGDSITHDDANYGGTGGKDKWNYAAPVGSFAPNGYGLYDVAGNVWEWCADWYDKSYYANSPKRNPKGPSSGSERVFRGGSWGSDFGDLLLLAAYRHSGDPTNSDEFVGFRCALDARP